MLQVPFPAKLADIRPEISLIFYLTAPFRYCIIEHMKMTRQHFQALADTCAEIIVSINANRTQTDSIILSFCNMCERSNPAFDSGRFVDWVQGILIKNS